MSSGLPSMEGTKTREKGLSGKRGLTYAITDRLQEEIQETGLRRVSREGIIWQVLWGLPFHCIFFKNIFFCTMVKYT